MPPLSQATREILWNVPAVPLMYVLFVAALAVFVAGLWRRIRTWMRGRPAPECLADWGARVAFVLKEVFVQRRVRRKRAVGLVHAALFYSFLVLVVTTGVIALDEDFGTDLFRGLLYVVLSVASEAGGLFVLLGVCVALWRRYVSRLPVLEAKGLDAAGFALLGLVIVTGFVVEALRIAVAGDAWGGLSFVAAGLAPVFSGVDAGTGHFLHASLWWVHAVLAFTWMASVPYTNYRHLLLVPANAFFAKRKPAGELARVDLAAALENEDFDEDEFRIGVDTAGDLTWKQRLDGDACVECGRCDEVCPALQAGRPFSPRRLVVGLRDLVSSNDGAGSAEIVGNAFAEDFVWHCLTCMACVQECPACIPHVDTFVEIRRSEVSMRGRADADISRIVRAMEVQGNPFGSQIARGEWVKSLGVRIVGDGESCDVLYWIGCLSSFDDEKRRIAVDLMKILERSGIDFGVLGKAEVCCGDPARVCGAESIFQETARKQVEVLNARRFRTLLVSCPHCYNVLKNEYPQFGGRYAVMHHSELLRDLLRAGKLQVEREGGSAVVYHDPCYLGRYQGIYDAPREVLAATCRGVPGEMVRSRDRSFCCGGGGGHFWKEAKQGERIDTMRIRQAKEAGARTVVTGCPYCFHMLGDAIKTMNLERDLQVVDLVSRLAPR